LIVAGRRAQQGQRTLFGGADASAPEDKPLPFNGKQLEVISNNEMEDVTLEFAVL
jgi:hypothetical protein